MALATFKGGIHPPDKKEFSKGRAISPAKPPNENKIGTATIFLFL
jgi:hypothetical protein